METTNFDKKVLGLHKKSHGKIKVINTVPINNKDELKLVGTPGVGAVCQAVAQDPQALYDYTIKGNTIAVISNGTAVLGLGDVGCEQALAVLEHKVNMYRSFAHVNAWPICIQEKDPHQLVAIISKITAPYGAIHLEDIAAPECFEVEDKLKQITNLPVFHDDRHGTSVVIGAAVINACRLTKRKIADLKVCLCGLGAAGLESAKMLAYLGVKTIYGINAQGVVNQKNYYLFDSYIKKAIDEKVLTLASNEKTTVHDLIKGTDFFLGLSKANLLQAQDIKNMNPHPWVFALANPVPEINLALAREAGAFLTASGSPLECNQINNLLAFPGIMKAALELRGLNIDLNVKKAAAYGIADIIKPQELRADYLIPDVFYPEVATKVKDAVIRSNKQK